MIMDMIHHLSDMTGVNPPENDISSDTPADAIKELKTQYQGHIREAGDINR